MSNDGTELACMACTHIVKERAIEAQLAGKHDLAPEFGKAFDSIRSLGFNEASDYAGYRKLFREVWDRFELLGSNFD